MVQASQHSAHSSSFSSLACSSSSFSSFFSSPLVGSLSSFLSSTSSPARILALRSSLFFSQTATLASYITSAASSFSSVGGMSSSVIGASSLSWSKSLKVTALCLIGLALPASLPFVLEPLLFLAFVGSNQNSSRSSFFPRTCRPSMLLCSMSFCSSFFSTSLPPVRLLQNLMVCSSSVISVTKGCSSNFSTFFWRLCSSHSFCLPSPFF